MRRLSRNLYFKWLLDQVDFDSTEYKQLMSVLNTILYISEYMSDEDRIEDCYDLRWVYSESKEWMDKLPRSVTMLEVLISMAIRVNDTIGTTSRKDIFEMFLKNMNLLKCDDEWFSYNSAPDSYIQNQCDIAMYHLYKRNGSGGGLFVIKDQAYDMCKADLFWQMQHWIKEQYISDM